MVSPNSVNWSQPVNWKHPLNRGLLSWWLAVPNRMGFGSPTWRDMTQRYNATLTSGPTWQPGGKGRNANWGTLSFDGTDDYVNCTNLEPILRTSPMSVALWVNATTPGTLQVLFTTGYGAGASMEIELGRTANKISIYHHTDVGVTGNVSLSANTWYHVTCTRSGSSGSWPLSIYVNGVLDNSATATADPTIQFDSTLIGRLRTSDTVGIFLGGYIDDVHLYTRGLSAPEVAELYAESRRGYPKLLRRIGTADYAPEQAAAAVANTPRLLLMGVG